jgi:hypothetical protein
VPDFLAGFFGFAAFEVALGVALGVAFGTTFLGTGLVDFFRGAFFFGCCFLTLDGLASVLVFPRVDTLLLVLFLADLAIGAVFLGAGFTLFDLFDFLAILRKLLINYNPYRNAQLQKKPYCKNPKNSQKLLKKVLTVFS